MARKRRIEVFSLSFLDCISCGFGAVVLLFVIINSQVNLRATRAGEELAGDTTRIDERVLEGRKDLVRLRNALTEEREEQKIVTAEARRIEEMLKTLRAQLATRDEDGSARQASVEQLQADIRQLEEANRRLVERAAREPASGERIRSFTGEGNRQYLTGIRMGGKRVVILVDASASMLGRNFVNVLRFNQMADAKKLRAPKWRQVVDTVDWLTTQIRPGTEVQVIAFNEKPWSLLGSDLSRWVEVQDGTELEGAVRELRRTVPRHGTSLVKAFRAVAQLTPLPDNLYLITDGLPTQSEVAPAPAVDVRPDQRAGFFRTAVAQMPLSVPVNVFLFPMDGDPAAAGLFWQLAVRSRGTLLTPTTDWP